MTNIIEKSAVQLGWDEVCGRGAPRKFRVTITETLQTTVEVEASDPQQAKDMVVDGWRRSEYVLNADNFLNAEFKAVPAADKSYQTGVD